MIYYKNKFVLVFFGVISLHFASSCFAQKNYKPQPISNSSLQTDSVENQSNQSYSPNPLGDSATSNSSSLNTQKNNSVDEKLDQLLSPATNNSANSATAEPSVTPTDPQTLADLRNLELYWFSTTYDEHLVSDRLSHLENKVFGKVKTGSDSSRIANLKSKLPKTCNISQTVDSIPYSTNDGDFFSNITLFENGNVLRFNQFPITISYPEGINGEYKKELDFGIKTWGKYIPFKFVEFNENPDITVAFVDHLPKTRVGITRIIAKPAEYKAVIYLLKPNYYPKNVPTKVMKTAFAHDIGHALGILGHCDFKGDLMSSDPFMVKTKYPANFGGFRTNSRNYAPTYSFNEPGVSKMDINTIKKIYQTPCVSNSFALAAPKEFD